jgi:putative SOS response-associated peptidase YedK
LDVSGRFTLGKDPRKLAVHFDVAAPPWDHPRYNVAPSQDIIIVRGDENVGREAVLTQWGSVPSWSKDPDEGPRPINAKAETVATSPAFRSPFKKRRCLIPANGFFEWAATGKVKTPYHFRLKDRGLFAFAGLWEHWKHENRDPLETSTIITTEANDVVRPIHARMPVILDPN